MEKLEALAKRVEALRSELLFDDDFKDGVLDCIAEQEVLMAVHFLACAESSLSKALYLQRRAVAQSPARHFP